MRLKLLRLAQTPTFGCLALGGITYYVLALINDLGEPVPFWPRIAALIAAASAARLGLWLDERKMRRAIMLGEMWRLSRN